jgi:oligopeptide transport system permease protein
VPEEVLEALEAQYNLNQPLWQQYVNYLGDVLQGDMGPSFKYPGRSVNELILSGLGTTAELGFYAMMVAIFIGVIAGVTASMRPNTGIALCHPLGMVAGVWLGSDSRG